MKSLTGEEVESKTITGDKPVIKCSKILSNQMQCSRTAVIGRHDDPNNTRALCSICYSLEGLPAGYQKEIGR